MITGLSQASVKGIGEYVNYIKYVDGILHLYGTPVPQLVAEKKIAAPGIIFCPERAYENAQKFKAAFTKYFPNFRPFYALKSCYIGDIVTKIRGAGFGIEVMSDYEMKIALHQGYTAKDMSLNGVGRWEAYAAMSEQYNPYINFLDCIEDIRDLNERGKQTGKIFNIGLRVNIPDISNKEYFSNSNKLGIEWEGGDFIKALAFAKGCSHLNLKGILCHQFYHLADTEKYRTKLQAYKNIILELYHQHGYQFDIIDIGGGYETRFLMEMRGVKIEDLASTAAVALSGIPYHYVLQAQPGRYLTADAAIGLTSVIARKDMPKSSWLITDVGSNILIPLPDIAYHPLPVNVGDEAEWKKYHLGDSTCAPARVCLDCELPELGKGDQMMLLNCGAYTSVFSQVWAFLLPNFYVASSDGHYKNILNEDDFYAIVERLYKYKF